MSTTPLDRNEFWHLMNVTAAKVLSESARPDKNLRHLVLLCCTLDTNLLHMQEIAPEIALENKPEALPADDSEDADDSKESDDSDDWDDSDDSHDSDESEDSYESEYPDGFDKWSFLEASKAWKLPEALDDPDSQMAGDMTNEEFNTLWMSTIESEPDNTLGDSPIKFPT